MRDHEMFFEWDFKIISREFGEIAYGNLAEIWSDSAEPRKTREEKVKQHD